MDEGEELVVLMALVEKEVMMVAVGELAVDEVVLVAGNESVGEVVILVFVYELVEVEGMELDIGLEL